MSDEKDRGIFGFRLGPVRRAVYGFLGGTEHKPSSEPASAQEAQPADELEKLATRAAEKYRRKIEGATERYRKRWAEAMRK